MTYTEKARIFRTKIDAATKYIPDDVVQELSDLFPVWLVPNSYDVGDRVRHDKHLYRCLTTHDAQANWAPGSAPSIWVRIDDPAEEWPDWRQPSGGHEAYPLGAKVTHKDKHWISTNAANVWEPGIFGWENPK